MSIFVNSSHIFNSEHICRTSLLDNMLMEWAREEYQNRSAGMLSKMNCLVHLI